MWTVAESGDPHAISEFGDRYPTMREELLKRMKTVQALKAVGHQVSPTSVPRFRNPQTAPPNWRAFYIVLGMALLFVLAFAGFRNAATPTKTVEVPPVNINPDPLPGAKVEIIPHAPQVPLTNDTSTNQPVPSKQPENYVPSPESQRTNLQLDSVTLKYAIFAVAEKGKLQCTIAPGLPDITIRLDFRDMTPMEMLKNLGQQYAFSTLLDGDHAVMIIPKKDEEEGQTANETR